MTQINGNTGVVGAGLTIVNSGLIQGGFGGGLLEDAASDLVFLGDAIRFTGGVNSLTLEAGSEINGFVIAYSAKDTLALGGAENSHFDVSEIGLDYQGFGVFEKTGASVWTLSGATSEVTNWAVDGGTLAVHNNGNLGAKSGNLSLDGGALELLGDFSTSRDVALESSGGTIDVTHGHADFSGELSGGGALTKNGSGELILSYANENFGGVVLDTGALELAARRAAGSGAIDFASTIGETATLIIENDALAGHRLDNTIDHFSVGDALDLTGLSFAKGASATFNAKTDILSVTSGGATDRFHLVDPLVDAFIVSNNGSGGTRVTLIPVPGHST